MGIMWWLIGRSAEGRWRRRVLELQERASIVLGQQNEALRSLPGRQKRQNQQAISEALDRYLRSQPISSLEPYPGIGPVTIARIESAGYRSLADLARNPNVNAPGLGEKRLSDISAAMNKAVAEAAGRLQAGACPEGQDLLNRLESLRRAMVREKRQINERIRACNEFLVALKPFVEAAHQMSFWRCIFRKSSLPGPEWLTRKLPDLDEYLARAKMPDPASKSGAAVDAAQPRLPPGRRDIAPLDLFEQALKTPRGTVPTQTLEKPLPAARLANATDDLETIVQFAYAVARADGRIARREKEVIAEYLAKRSGRDAAQANRIKAYCAHYESAPIDLERCLQSLGIGRSREDCEELLEFAEAIADASGPRNTREAEFLKRVAFALGLPGNAAPTPAVQTAIPAPTGNGVAAIAADACSREQQLAVLEIDPALPLSADLIRRQYNLLTERFAPEKFVHAGADFAAMAQAKRVAVHAAALALLEPLGEPLEVREPAVQDLRQNPDLDAIFSGS